MPCSIKGEKKPAEIFSNRLVNIVMATEREVKRINVNGSFCFDLPEDCIVNPLSLTTPGDACCLSMVATSFRDAAKSDAVWERLLPHDYKQIISRLVDKSSSPLRMIHSKKDLFMYLCDHKTLIDGGLKVKWIGLILIKLLICIY